MMDNNLKNTWTGVDKLILDALLEEWIRCCRDCLNATEQAMIKIPCFILGDTPGRLGQYAKGELVKTLEINRNMVLEHPWYVVVDVLRHEIAHQVVAEAYPLCDEPPHGPLFRNICKRLCANSEARTSEIELDKRIFLDEYQNANGNSLFEKIRKLLVMAEKGEENEAEVALAKAMELMAKNGISQYELNNDRQYTTIYLGKPFKKLDKAIPILTAIISEFWEVRVLISFAPSFADASSELTYCRCIEASGTPENLKIASYVFDFIVNYIDSSWLKYCVGNRVKVSAVKKKQDFAYGLLSAFLKKLRSEAEAQNIEALVLRKDLGLESYCNRKYPHIRTTHSQAYHFDKDAVNSGYEAGKNLSINPGIENNSSAPKQLNM